MYRFNIPDNWVLPYDFTPERGWRPNLSWGAPPSNWQWWVLEDYDPNPRLPPVVDKGEFNGHPAEVAAVAAEREYVTVIQRARAAVEHAAKTRKEREIADPSSHLYKLDEEAQAEQWIERCREVRCFALGKRREADRVHEEWLKQRDNNTDIIDSLLSSFPTETGVPVSDGAGSPSAVSPVKPVVSSAAPKSPLGAPPPVPTLSVFSGFGAKTSQKSEATASTDGPATDSRREAGVAEAASSSSDTPLSSVPQNDPAPVEKLSQRQEPVPPQPVEPVVPVARERKFLPDWFRFMDGLIDTAKNISLFNYRKPREKLVRELETIKSDVELCDQLLAGRSLRLAEESLQKAKLDSRTMVEEAEAEAKRILAEAEKKAKKTVTTADVQAKKLIQEANLTVERLEREADLIIFNNVAYYDYEHPAESSAQLHGNLDWVKTQIRNMIRSKTATSFNGSFAFNGSVTQGRKFVNKLSGLMLTAYNQEVENAILKATTGKNLELALKRLDTARDRVSKMGEMIDLRISTDFHELRVQELRLTFQYKDQLEFEKELERERRAILREEDRVRREAEKEQAQLEKDERDAERRLREYQAELERRRIAQLEYEESHYENALQQAEAIERLNESNTLVAELQAKLKEIRDAKGRVTERLANTRAGYVYVISNIGAFGDGIVKIGLTRRQEPLDRIKELSSASVPFPFDVHAIQFSHDAVQLETSLHRYFSNRKVNKVNPRKEYFYATPKEVRFALEKFADGPLLKFKVEAEADQWRRSSSVR